MKYNEDLALKILLYLESPPQNAKYGNVSIEGYSQEEVWYHIKKLDEKGFVQGINAETFGRAEWNATDLTSAGHDFLNKNRDQKQRRIKNALLNESQVIWLEAIREKLKLEQPVDFRELKIELRDKLPKFFDPEEINGLFLKGKTNITLLGIALVEPQNKLIEFTDKIIKAIQEILTKAPKTNVITANQISETTDVKYEYIEKILELLANTGIFHNSGINGKYGWSAININEQAFDNFLMFDSVAKWIEYKEREIYFSNKTLELDVVNSNETTKPMPQPIAVVKPEIETKISDSLKNKIKVKDPYRLKGTLLANQYLLEEYLGGGGMGAVYLASQKDSQQLFAIKILKPDVAARSPEYVQLFEQEVASAKKLDHPNIVKIFDSGTDDDISFMVMELLEGHTLEDEINNGKIEIEFVREAFRQICSAFIYAHSRNIIHLDIKPANIFILSAPQQGNFVKVIDFGLARILSSETGTTVTRFKGTDKFCSPEHFGGKFTNRSDIYSLGATLYNMLTGVIPFGMSYVQAKIHPNLELPPIPSILAQSPNLPSNLDVVIEKALMRNPLERQESVQQLLNEFEQAVSVTLSNTAILAESPSNPEISNIYDSISARKFWLMSHVIHSAELPFWLTTSNWTIYLDSVVDNLKEGDVIYVANSDGIYAWGVLLEKLYSFDIEQSGIKIGQMAIDFSLISKTQIQNTQEISKILSFPNGKFTELSREQVEILDSLLPYGVAKPPLTVERKVRQNVKLSFENNGNYVETHYSNDGSRKKIIRMKVENVGDGDKVLGLETFVDLEDYPNPFISFPLTLLGEQTDHGTFNLPSGGKQFINVLEWHSKKPNIIRFSATNKHLDRSSISVELNQKIIIVINVLGNMKPYSKRFSLYINDDGIQIEEITD